MLVRREQEAEALPYHKPLRTVNKLLFKTRSRGAGKPRPKHTHKTQLFQTTSSKANTPLFEASRQTGDSQIDGYLLPFLGSRLVLGIFKPDPKVQTEDHQPTERERVSLPCLRALGMFFHLDPEDAIFAELRSLLPANGVTFELMEIGGRNLWRGWILAEKLKDSVFFGA